MPVQELTPEMIQEVPCIICNAKIGARCTDGHTVLFGYHKERTELRAKLPAVELSKDDKALIVFYAFVILCDSASNKSEALVGKHVSSIELQKFFCAKAIEELKKDGFLK